MNLIAHFALLLSDFDKKQILDIEAK